MTGSTTDGNEWRRDHGPNRPFWEPVRLVDFDGKRLVGLRELQAVLQAESETPNMTDNRLALYATIELLFSQTTVTAAAAAAELTRLATLRLPAPSSRKARRKLTAGRRDELLVVAGQMWQIFTAPNFPLAPPNPTEPEA